MSHFDGPVSPTVPAWVSGLLAMLFLLQCAHGLAVKSGTADELGAHLPAGILHWRSGVDPGGVDNPPLGQLLVAAGPVLTGAADHPLLDSPRHLLPARIPVVLLGLATVWLIGAMGRRLGGPLAGVAALGAAALSPNLVAHSRLATMDLPVTAFIGFALLLAWRQRESPSPIGFVALALALGTAASIKSTALHLVPALALGTALLPGRPRERIARSGTVVVVALVGIVAAAWLSSGPGPAQWGLPAKWLQGVLGKWEHGREGHFAYLLGQRRTNGFASYFLVALAVKTPLPILIAGAAGLWALVRRRLSGDVAGFAALVALPALWILAAMSLVHRVDIGLRHVLPALPVALAVAGAGWARLWASGRAWRVMAVVLAGALLVTAARTTPDHLAYFQALAGGPDRGDRILIDSNLDWGQDDGRLRAWARGRDVHVNPARPVTGTVAANVNAIHGILRPDDLRLRWVTRLPVERSFGHTWRVVVADEDLLARAAPADPVAALDFAWWLVGTGRPAEALPILDRNDLSVHPRHGVEWWRVRAEALLLQRQWREAAVAAARGGDPDLEAEIAYRSGVPVDDAHLAAVIGALARRGCTDEASELGRERTGRDPLAVAPARPGLPAWNEIARQKELGRERQALQLAGARLAEAPDDSEALALYGELVVRRKLGLTEYAWPDVDWSVVQRPGRR